MRMRFRDLKTQVTPAEFDLADLLEDGFTTTHLVAVRHSQGDINMVTWEGDFTPPADVENGDTILTTPPQLVPKQNVTVGIFADDGSDYGVLRFEADGDIKVYGSITGSKKYTVTGSTIIDPWRGP